MNIVIVTPPPVEPVTIEEAFVHLRLDDPTEDNPDTAAVEAQIVSAREQCEQITRRAFVQQTLRLTRGPARRNGERRGWDWFIGGGCVAWGDIELLRPPFIEMVSLKYFDDANTQQTVAPADYFVTSDLVPKLRFVNGFSTPSIYLRDDAIQVEYVAGYAPKPADPDAEPPTQIDYRANVPASIKQAILLAVQLQYDELTPDKRKALENARDALLSSYRVHTF
uniref:Phage gp6-like head-tail connector protein n=1 Tax=Variovorax paradoxus (strain S110) TaxID=543728 RepID=C5CJQ0_VARPS